jgi:pimeloyl-ACP methyl ester carboxylesterase
MTDPYPDTLSAPGARLHYEVRGRGPVLLMICGGIYDAAGYAALADRLADAYTVVTYDRRGNSRSPLAGPPREQRVAEHADDAALLLAKVGAPAAVFGNSSGAIIGLDLVARRPELVRTLVAHEPPLFELLSEREHWRGVAGAVASAFATEGPDAATAVLFGAFAAAGDPPPTSASPPGPETERVAGNVPFFVGYEMPPFARYAPDLPALRAAATRVVVGVGAASGEQAPPRRAALALARRLGTPPVWFPGHHGGFGAEPDAFASTLRSVV